MKAKFKARQLVRFCDETKRVYRDVLGMPEIAEQSGVVLNARLDAKRPGDAVYLYTVELTNGEVAVWAESHLENLQ